MKKLFSLTVLTAAAALTLAGCSQGSTATVVGTWGAPDAPKQPALVLEEDGSLHGTNGCNNLMGQYESEGNKVTFGPIATTLMFCEGVDEWLNQAATAEVSADTMTLFNEAGDQIGTLERAS